MFPPLGQIHDGSLFVTCAEPDICLWHGRRSRLRSMYQAAWDGGLEFLHQKLQES